jgi:hypothetical protein
MLGSTRRVFHTTFFLACVLVSLAALTPANAAVRRQFTATISPAATSIQTPTSFVVTIRNRTQSQANIGSANITFPASFTSLGITSVTAPAGKNWTATLSGNTVQLRSGIVADKLAPGQSVAVGVTGTVTSTGTKVLTVLAKQSNNFSGTNTFNIVGAQPSVHVSGDAVLCDGGSCSVETPNFEGGPTVTNPVAGRVTLDTGGCEGDDCFLVIDTANCGGSHGCVNNEIFFFPPSNQSGMLALEYLCDLSVCSAEGSSFKEDENGEITPVFDCPSSEPGSEDLPCILERSTESGFLRLLVLFGEGDPRFRTGSLIL